MNFIISNPMDAAQYHTYYHLSPDLAGFQDAKDHKRSHSGSSFHPSINPSEAPPLEEVRLLEREPDGSICKLDGIKAGEYMYNSGLEESTRTVINISGLRFETQLKTLNRLPSTLLGSEEKRRKYWDPVRKEYFFDRHRPSFAAILYYYQSGGRLKRPLEVPLDIFLEELEFYELGRAAIDMYKESEGMVFEKQLMDIPYNSLNKLWILFEYPNTSISARIIGILSVVFIMLSVVVFCLETLPVLKEPCSFTIMDNDTGRIHTFIKPPDYRNWMFIAESVCIVWFVLEFAVRTISCPSKIMFVKSIVNWIDLAAIVPYFVFLGMSLATNTCLASNKSGLLQVLRVFRVVRIFKLAKHSQGLKILGKTLQLSLSELNTFLIFFAIGVVIFSTMVYFADLGESQSFFTSIPDAFWWAVITMTTVGYGDVYPVGIAGKFVGGLCVLSGLLAISLPVPVIVTNFNNIYKNTTGRGRDV